MSIFDASVQDDWTRDDLVAKIKAAEKKYYNESPCLHCGPGNGCDDCRGCEDAQRNYELAMNLRKVKQAYEDKFGHSYEQDVMYNQIENKEKEYNTWKVKCQKCGGNFDEDCKDCKDWEEKFNVIKSLNWLKEEFKRKFKLDYNIINKNTIKNDMTIDEKKKI